MAVEIVLNPYYSAKRPSRVNVLAQVRDFKKVLDRYGVSYEVVELNEEHKEFLLEFMDEDYYKIVRFNFSVPDSCEKLLENLEFMRNVIVIDRDKFKIGFENSEDGPYSLSVFKPRMQKRLSLMDILSTEYYDEEVS